jgi:transposase
MANASCAAGVDVGRDFLDLAVAPSGFFKRVGNAPKGVAALIGHLRRAGVTRVVIEAIGSYAARLTEALREGGFEVGVVDPRRIRAWRTAEGGRAKTDRLDAHLMARFALAMPETLRPLPDAETVRLRALSARRRQLVEMIAAEKTRLKQALDQTIAESHRNAIKQLGVERAHIEATLKAAVLAAGGAERMTLLQSAPGVGPAIALTLCADLPELGALDRRAIASLAGLAPHIEQSGLDRGRATIAGGRPCVRSALYMAALVAARSDEGRKAEYAAMRAAGKPAKVALIAIARKILVALSSMVREKRPWSPNSTKAP